MSLITGLGRSHGDRNGYVLQYVCLRNSIDRGALQFMGSQKSQIRLSEYKTTFYFKKVIHSYLFIHSFMHLYQFGFIDSHFIKQFYLLLYIFVSDILIMLDLSIWSLFNLDHGCVNMSLLLFEKFFTHLLTQGKCCLGNPMDGGACWVRVHGVTKESDMT